MRFPLLSKLAAIGLVTLLLTFVLMRIQWLVDERRQRQAQARVSVEQSLAGAQTLLGPLLQRSCTEEWDVAAADRESPRKTTVQRREFQLTSTPQTLAVQTDARSEPRYRGLFKVNGYAGTSTLQARWGHLAELQPRAEQAGGRVRCGPVQVMLALSDVRGIRSARVQADGETLVVQAGTQHGRFPRGLHALLPDSRTAAVDAPLAITVTLDLVGTSRLALVPAAGETSWTLRSDWPHPSFVGRFLPTAREVSAAGFSARWSLSALASPAAAEVRGLAELCTAPAAAVDDGDTPLAPRAAAAGKPCLDTLDVEFIDPVNPYVLTDRATKYALLFIVLTFGAVALTELLSGRRVHPVQYAMVGLALALFFLLLLSLSEHVGYGAAYAAASAACVLLLGFYAAHMMGRRRAGIAFGAGIALLYGLLWVLLQREQTALVIGSVMLFALLAVVMVLTRRVDWYGPVERPRAGTPSAGDMAA